MEELERLEELEALQEVQKLTEKASPSNHASFPEHDDFLIMSPGSVDRLLAEFVQDSAGDVATGSS